MSHNKIPRLGGKTAPVANVNLHAELVKCGVPYGGVVGYTIRRMIFAGVINGKDHRIVPGTVGKGNGAMVSKGVVKAYVEFACDNAAEQAAKWTKLHKQLTKALNEMK